MLPLGLLVVHDAVRSGHHDVAELTGRQQAVGPAVDVTRLDVEAGRDATTLVDAAEQLNNDLAATVVIDDLELANVL